MHPLGWDNCSRAFSFVLDTGTFISTPTISTPANVDDGNLSVPPPLESSNSSSKAPPYRPLVATRASDPIPISKTRRNGMQTSALGPAWPGIGELAQQRITDEPPTVSPQPNSPHRRKSRVAVARFWFVPSADMPPADNFRQIRHKDRAEDLLPPDDCGASRHSNSHEAPTQIGGIGAIECLLAVAHR